MTRLLAATCAAKAVFFRDPSKPKAPVEDQHKVFPKRSVNVIIVLRKPALT